MKKRTLIIVSTVFCLSALGVFAEGTKEKGSEDSNGEKAIISSVQVTGQSESSDANLAKKYADKIISLSKAQTLVQQANQGKSVISISLENENGYLVYHAGLDDGTEVIIDAGNGKTLAHDKQDREERRGESRDSEERQGEDNGGDEE